MLARTPHTSVRLPVLALLCKYLAVLVSSKPCEIPGASCALSPDINTWSIAPGLAGEDGKDRFWTREELDLTIDSRSGVTHPARAKIFFDKLNSGEKIVSVALGSSLVHDYAGCFQPSFEALWDEGCIPNPMLYPQQGAHKSVLQWDYTSKKCGTGGGFMEGLMATINASWPNNGHIFFNNGKGGSCLGMIADANCFQSFIPKQVDLVLLDTATNLCNEGSAERMLRYFLKHPSKPLVFFFTNSRNCDYSMIPGARPDFKMCLSCLTGPKYYNEFDSSAPAPSVEGCLPFQNITHSIESHTFWETNVVNHYAAIAARYQIPHISMHAMLGHFLFAKPTKMEELNVTVIDVISRVYKDAVHYNKREGGVGTILTSDMILHWLAREQEALDAMSDEDKAKLDTALDKPLPEPVHPNAKVIPHQRCYGFDFRDVIKRLSARPDLETNGEIRQVLNHYKDLVPGDTFEFDGTSGGFKTLPTLPVIREDGWELQAYYKGASGLKYKAGYVSETPNATIVFEVNTVFPEATALHVPAEIMVQYTRSYDGWGIAEVSCVSGCTCQPSMLNAHHEEHSSLLVAHRMIVSQGGQCQVQLRIMKATESGGHKFKLSSITVEYEEMT